MAANLCYIVTASIIGIGQHPMPMCNLFSFWVNPWILPTPIIIRRGAVIAFDCHGVLGSMIGILGVSEGHPAFGRCGYRFSISRRNQMLVDDYVPFCNSTSNV